MNHRRSSTRGDYVAVEHWTQIHDKYFIFLCISIFNCAILLKDEQLLLYL